VTNEEREDSRRYWRMVVESEEWHDRAEHVTREWVEEYLNQRGAFTHGWPYWPKDNKEQQPE
jgi:hypothetical protein